MRELYSEQVTETVAIIFDEYVGSASDLEQCAEVVYNDGFRYELGKVTLHSPNDVSPLGCFVWDANYIYKCCDGYEKVEVEVVFDVENRKPIESKEKREELYDAFVKRFEEEKKQKQLKK